MFILNGIFFRVKVPFKCLFDSTIDTNQYTLWTRDVNKQVASYVTVSERVNN